jgi:hypothetical protein
MRLGWGGARLGGTDAGASKTPLRRTDFLALLGLLAGLIIWLWPIGFGGRMPVGGDVTSFSLGLMAVLARAIRVGRLPIWNDLWGYGFPGLAESQMGAYYPPHLVLYGLLPLEAAYTASLVLHTLWGGLGGAWAARRFGVSAVGAALAGFSWAGCGFFVIHLQHQWGYTTGSWMPWAWGLAWLLASGRGTRRTPLWLALVLTLQVLPGHFQLAFITEVGVVLLTLAALAEPSVRRAGGRRGMIGVVLALLAVAPLGAMQLWPTFDLARLAAAQRDSEYLSGFASTPVHLVSFVAPGLFHRSPLWRPVAWEPFLTSPEESLAYIGLAPLFLALGAPVRRWRREPEARVLGIVALATLALSLGPYMPGFSLLIRLPGFSFFRAPARWTLATELALCLLAGRGFDALRAWARPGGALVRFVLIAALAPCLVVGMLELGLTVSARSRSSKLARWMNAARRLQNHTYIASTLARQGRRLLPPGGLSLVGERRSIYAQELGPTAMLLGALLAVAAIGGRRGLFQGAMLTLSVIDLCSFSRQRLYDLGPIRPLTAQSPVLARLAREPQAGRMLGPARNLPMVAGAAPVSAYRSLDLPTMVSLTTSASLCPWSNDDGLSLAALRATGTSLRILDPFELQVRSWGGRSPVPSKVPGWSSLQQERDPALAGWIYGTDWVAGLVPQTLTFTLWRPWPKPAHAWLLPLTPGPRATILAAQTRLDLLQRIRLGSARPQEVRSTRPERLEVTVEVEAEAGDLMALIITQLADPRWRGWWIGPDGAEHPAPIVPVYALADEWGWQAVKVPGTGRWTLHLEYADPTVTLGLILSGVSFLILIGLALVLRPGRPPQEGELPGASPGR